MVTTTLMGIGAFPETHPLSIGSGGVAMTRMVPHFLDKADVIFGIGCSFTESSFAVKIPGGKTIIHSTLDPNHPNDAGGAKAGARNKAVTDPFEPGSTMKPFTTGLALETGRVRPDTLLSTGPRSVVISGWSPTDSHPHGDLTVQQVIQKSSNIGAARMALMMQPREMHEMFTAIGLGQRPQISFPGAVTGKLRPWKSWRPIEQATMSYGYGLSASLFQLARAYTVFARDGEIIPVSILRQPHDHPVPGIRVFSPKVTEEVRQMLQAAAGPGGTAPQAQVPGYSVGGKTGTAHKVEGRGYSGNKYRAWFVGIAPISKPRIVVAVMVDEPSNGVYFGGDVAAPVFSQVVQQTLHRLGVVPDLEVQQQIQTNIPAEVESF